MNNTDYADINEMHFAYVLNGEAWPDKKTEILYQRKLDKLDQKEASSIINQSHAMAKEFTKWAKNHGYSGTVVNVHWDIDHPRSIEKITGIPTDYKRNPSDVLIRFTKGPAGGFLGVSLKSHKTLRGKYNFKNLGLGTVERTLDINLSSLLATETTKVVRKLNLPKTARSRTLYIRRNPSLQKSTSAAGSKILSKIRDLIYNKLNSMSQRKLRDYILDNWLDSNVNLYPPYVRVISKGNKATVEDPLENDKLGLLMTKHIKLSLKGNASINISAGSQNIISLRPKFASEKLGSSVKVSADPLK